MKLILGCFETCWTRPFHCGVASHPSGRKGRVLQRRARRGCPWQRSWVCWLMPKNGCSIKKHNENQHSTWCLNPETFRFCSMIRYFGFQDRVSSNFNICNSERNNTRWCKCQIGLRPMMYQQNRWALCNLTPFHFGSPNDLTQPCFQFDPQKPKDAGHNCHNSAPKGIKRLLWNQPLLVKSAPQLWRLVSAAPPCWRPTYPENDPEGHLSIFEGSSSGHS